MIIKIDGKKVAFESVYYREKGFSRPAPNGYGLKPYEWTVPQSEFCRCFQSYYKDHAEDDRSYPSDANGIDLELRDLGWPTLEELFSKHKELAERFLMRLSAGPIQDIYRERTLGEVSFWITSVESIKIEEQSIIYRGEVLFRSKPL